MPGKMYANGESYGGYFSDSKASELVPGANFTLTNTACVRSGGIAFVNGKLTGTVAENTTIATLPTGFVPDREVKGISVMMVGDTTIQGFVKITTAGEIIIDSSVPTNCTEVNMNISFVV